MKCKHCDGTGKTKDWISEPCAYCGGTGELPDDFTEMMKLKNCKKCGGEAVFSGVFDDPKTFRFPKCIKCGARAEGNSVKDSWYERARKWNEQNTQKNEEWMKSLDTEGLVDYLFEVHKGGASVERQAWIEKHKERVKMQIRGWLKAKHIEKE